MAEVKATMDELARSQRQTGEAIEAIIRNIKKDPSERKNVNYYRERLRRLNSAWSDFEKIDTEIRCLEEPAVGHDYYVSGYYNKMSDLTEKYQEMLESELMNATTGVAQTMHTLAPAGGAPTNSGVTLEKPQLQNHLLEQSQPTRQSEGKML